MNEEKNEPEHVSGSAVVSETIFQKEKRKEEEEQRFQLKKVMKFGVLKEAMKNEKDREQDENETPMERREKKKEGKSKKKKKKKDCYRQAL